MVELPLVFVSGLLGSSHCLGMCGPFALAIGGSAATSRENLFRQSLYSAGRIFTYTVLGAVAGFAGMRLSTHASSLVNVPALLAIAAGTLLVHQGLMTTGVFARRTRLSKAGPCLAGGLLAPLLKSPSSGHVFLAGMFTGFLPCGLVYAFVTLAAGTANMFWGAIVMIVFGLGTVPLMMATGWGGTLLSMAGRRRLYTTAAWCVVLAGLVSVYRGVSFITFAGSADSFACPFCP